MRELRWIDYLHPYMKADEEEIYQELESILKNSDDIDEAVFEILHRYVDIVWGTWSSNISRTTVPHRYRYTAWADLGTGEEDVKLISFYFDCDDCEFED